jgi:hypothetical protein
MDWAEDYKDEISNCIFQISMKVGNRTQLTKNVRPLLEIDFEKLENELEHLPPVLFFYEALLSEQKRTLATLEARKDLIKSKIASELNQKAEESDVKISDAKIRNLVMSDESVLRISCEIIQEQHGYDKLKAVVDCLIKKSEHLRSLAGFKRDERTRT